MAEDGASNARAPRHVGQLVRLLVLVGLTGALLAGVLSLVRPQYGSEARMMIEQAGGPGSAPGQRRSPEGLMLSSQIEVLRSPDLAALVVERNKLGEDPEFNEVLAPLPPMKHLAVLGNIIPNPANLPEKERVIRAFSDRLNVALVPDTRLVAVSFRSSDPDKSAKLANDLADTYVEWLAGSAAPRKPAEGASPAISAEIADLRARIEERATRLAELMAARQQSYDPATPARVDEARLFDLQSQLIFARAKREEIEAKAKQVREMLAGSGELQRTGELFNTGLIQRLLDRQAALQRRISEASASLLPSHPQMKRLKSELSELGKQVRGEAEGVAAGYESEAMAALEREKTLQASIEELRGGSGAAAEKTPAVSLSEIEAVKDALANDRRRLAQSEARRDVASIVQGSDRGVLVASVVTAARADHIPVFPKKLPVIVGGMAFVLLSGIIGIWMEAVLGWPRVDRRKGDRRDRRRDDRAEDEGPLPELKRPELLAPLGEPRRAANG